MVINIISWTQLHQSNYNNTCPYASNDHLFIINFLRLDYYNI